MSEQIREYLNRGLKAQKAVDKILEALPDEECEETLDQELFEEEQQQRADEESFDQ